VFSVDRKVFPLTGKCFPLTEKCFPLTNFPNGKQTQKSLESGFPESEFRETNMALKQYQVPKTMGWVGLRSTDFKSVKCQDFWPLQR
jgi:hypothetical protein